MPAKKNQQVADATITVDRAKMIAAAVAKDGHAITEEARDKNLASLSTEELEGAYVLFSATAQGFLEIAAAFQKEMAARDPNEFVVLHGKTDVTVAVTDSASGESYGGMSIATESKSVRSTSNKKNREEVLAALKKAGIDATYVRISEELQNDLLFNDLANGTLPASVSTLLTETTNTKRNVSFIPGLNNNGSKE